MTPDELRGKQDAFLDRYNAARSVAKAESDALMSAAQHNSLYAPGVNEHDRYIVRAKWKEFLNDIAARYKSPVSVAEYEADVEHLRKMMNARFSKLFRSDRHPKYHYDAGFRMSHAQKSLSVFLKHRWCLGTIDVPPQCPVDARVLHAAGARYPATRWAYVNTIEEHRSQVARLMASAQASGLRLAEWELVTFQA